LIELVESGSLIGVYNIGQKSVEEVKDALTQVQLVEELPSETQLESAPESERVKRAKTPIPPSDVIEWQSQLIKKQISAGLLHEQAKIGGEPISSWLSGIHNVHPCRAYETMANIIGGALNVCEELAFLLSDFTRKDYHQILNSRYGYEAETLEEIGSEIGVTRQRVRQIGEKLQTQIGAKVTRAVNDSYVSADGPALLRMQTALLVAEDMGLQITFEKWKDRILSSGLVGSWNSDRYSNFDAVETLIAVCNLLDDSDTQDLNAPANLQYAIGLAVSGTPELPAKVAYIRKTLPKETAKLVSRHAGYCGGVHAKWLSQEIGIDIPETHDILKALGYRIALDNWFIPQANRDRCKAEAKDAFNRAVRKMLQYCGPLSTNDICSGLRLYVSRTRFPVPPPKVMEEILRINRYELEDGFWQWNGKMDEDLSGGEVVIRNCFEQHRPVVHHSELAEAFVDSDLSFASLHATLRRSPIFDRIDTGLYRMRGVSVTSQDVERALASTERVSVNPEIEYDKRGNIIISVNLSVIALGTGIVVSGQFPNLSGDWDCYVRERRFGKLYASESEFRNLSEPFEFLGLQAGDRARFIFDVWERTVLVEEVKD
jgi:hypothetical protein